MQSYKFRIPYMKALIAAIAVIIIAGIGFVFWQPTNAPQQTAAENAEAAQSGSTVADGTYKVAASESTVNWSAKKPLIDGYVNSGSIGVTEGSIVVAGTSASGSFSIDMNTLKVGLTATKPGQEGTLEGHLKGDRWFDVAKYPTASFVITSVAPRADSATSNTYDVKGNLTLKGQTHELTFPSNIYMDASGKLRAQASFEFDRTKWGVTSGSSNFFENLADNAISDMVAMSFDIVALKQ